MRILKKIIFCFLLCPGGLYAQPSPDMNFFIQKMVTQHAFNEAEVTQLLNNAVIKDNILQTISKPAENVLPWFKYKNIFLSKQRIDEGLQFWKDNQAILEKAQRLYGVPPEIIVSIIGVETFYGKQKGSHRVLDALVTLAFNYPPRSAFFSSELEAFLLMTREENLDPTKIVGSYAGAMGMPQFIASSYRRFAVDFSRKGKRDLINNTEDAIGSVANYFAQSGWKPQEPVIFPVTHAGPENYIATLETHRRNPELKYTLGALTQRGIQLASMAAHLSPETPVAVIALEETQGPTYWLGLNNFYVITRYNHSNHYAMAVYELSQKIKALKEKEQKV